MRNQQEETEILPLRRRFNSNISIDRFSEKSIHGIDFDIRSCSKFCSINNCVSKQIYEIHQEQLSIIT